MTYILSVKSRKDFLRIQEECQNSFKNNSSILLYKETSEKILDKFLQKDFVRLGICVTKRIDKKAVVRNKIKRIFREAFRKIVKEEKIPLNFDYEIIAKKQILNYKFNEICKDLKWSIGKFKEKING